MSTDTPPPAPDSFRDLFARVQHLKVCHKAGADVYDELYATAARAAAAFNEEAKEIAKRFGKRPQTTTTTRILNQA